MGAVGAAETSRTALSGRISRTLLRLNYEVIVRYPLQIIEDTAITHLGDGAVLRLAYEDLLADLDSSAGRLLNDQSAAARAHSLRERTTKVRTDIEASRLRMEQILAVEGRRRIERYRRACEARGAMRCAEAVPEPEIWE